MSRSKCSVDFVIGDIVLVGNQYQVMVTRTDGIVMPMAHFQKTRIEKQMETRNQTIEQAITHNVRVYFQHFGFIAAGFLGDQRRALGLTSTPIQHMN
ncbi:MAG: hypothetical protein CMG60_08010 [Candidatus Marinimicrobia bacterium]|nr:hypothetical protein [Candidatus Neomarinimicrobiota bacterium]